MGPGTLLLIVLGLALVLTLTVYNGLAGLRRQVDNAFEQIRVQLARRRDLISRRLNQSGNDREALDREIKTADNKVAFARQYYNDVVTAYNAHIGRFPARVFARMGGFEFRKPMEKLVDGP